MLSVKGEAFVGLYVWPDAICVPEGAGDLYSERVKVQFDSSIPINKIEIDCADGTRVSTQWVSEPAMQNGSTYCEALLEVKVKPEAGYKDYLIFSIKGTVVKTMRIFCL